MVEGGRRYVRTVSDDGEPGSFVVGEAQVVRLRGGDGVEVVGDLVVAEDAWAGAVVCHPHPAYGGDRHNAVVDRIFHTLAAAGMTVLRFDFRPGVHGGEQGEQIDVVAGIDRVAAHLGPERPLLLVGYSFGADIALSVGDERVAGWVAVAPPLRFGGEPRPAEGDERPVLVLAAEHDQFSPPERLREVAAAWPDATVTVVPGADHFLAGATGHVADEVLAWLGVNGVRPREEPQ
jgi:alpha/beta superfamily hydrolase